jgi:5'(3')-deoxyribonucleotidase
MPTTIPSDGNRTDPQPDRQVRIDPTAVAFDIDSVVADTMRLFVKIVRNEFGLRHINYEDITSYNLLECLDLDETVIDKVIGSILSGTHAAPLEPIDGAVDVLTRLGNRHQPLVFISARPHLGAINEWFQGHLPVAQFDIETVATGSYEAKAEALMRRKRTFFVEDRLETCFLLDAVGITPILFKQPWNRRPHPFTEVDSWRELEALIDY